MLLLTAQGCKSLSTAHQGACLLLQQSLAPPRLLQYPTSTHHTGCLQVKPHVSLLLGRNCSAAHESCPRGWVALPGPSFRCSQSRRVASCLAAGAPRLAACWFSLSSLPSGRLGSCGIWEAFAFAPCSWPACLVGVGVVAARAHPWCVLGAWISPRIPLPQPRGRAGSRRDISTRCSLPFQGSCQCRQGAKTSSSKIVIPC